ncbi:DNA cytosine methyltransferase [Burkholderia multivorans]|uniref:DNA cytosine methyltransferase n=1 Tax=Burkholderia multivorans TaxID=87883 RepID=UPI002018C828|nr:DNA cytosine methyltransferase [Burkholderia multivorans]UQP02331.1 DNA cytosine methyltransferase [Burkholderia multivorans]
MWTGSCPCQPFSAAGKGGGFDDERHLWPHWHWLIAECRPAVVFGEQVASSAVDDWIDLVQTDVEALGYAYGCVPFPSAGVGAPHIRDRTFWLADAHHHRFQGSAVEAVFGTRWRQEGHAVGRGGAPLARGMGHADGSGSRRHAGSIHCAEGGAVVRSVAHGAESAGAACRMADADLDRQPPRRLPVRPGAEGQAVPVESGYGALDGAGPANGFWRAADWLLCRDGKLRPVEPGTFPLVDGAPARVGRLRAYGNAINAEAATAFIEAACDALGDYDLC